MLDPHLERAFAHAVNEARKRRHEYVTLEHLLYGIVLEEEGRIILDELGVNVYELKRSLETFFTEHLPSLPDFGDEIVQTMALQRVVQRSLRQMQAAGRVRAGIGDVLVCLLDEDSSYAACFLLAQGVTRLDVMEYISLDIGGTEEEQAEEESDNSQTKALKAYTSDLTALASEGKFDPLVGREKELERTLQILARRRKNNPLFVGEPGVGKTAMAEGLAQRIVKGDVPEEMKHAKLFALDLGGMMAGAKYRGDFEGRLKSVLAALSNIPNSILFIDEIHTVVGAGAVSGSSLDASNILKPLLGSGALRCIGSTTHEELRNHFEKDRAFSRRFQRVDIPEPSRDECLAIIKGLLPQHEKHHGVKYTEGALEAAVTLSIRYLTELRLPDKAIDLIDEAGARKRLLHPVASADKKSKTPSVTVADIEQVVAAIAKVPSVKATPQDKNSLKHLERSLKKVVFGQDAVVETVVRAILRCRAGFTQEGRPQGAFLFYGPTGVGKTELAKQLAASLGVAFLRYDMSEYMEKHAVARLIGAPPGYVGFDQGGLLTEAVRKTPHAVLLLDEVEKAHADIFNVLLQVMDYATLTDTSGRKADFRNITLIMTTNAGAFEMAARNIGFGTAAPGHAADKAQKVLERLFTPEFRNRLDAMVPFAPLTRDIMGSIVDKFIAQVQERLAEKKVILTLTTAAKNFLARKGYDPTFGARPLARVIREQIEDVLAGKILFGELTNGGTATADTKKISPAKSGKAACLSEEEVLVFTCHKASPEPVKKKAGKATVKKTDLKKATK